MVGGVVVGKILEHPLVLNLAAIEFNEPAIRESLPRRFQDENVAAVRFGYQLTDDEIARLAAAAPPSRFEMNDAATAPEHRQTGIATGAQVAVASDAGETG